MEINANVIRFLVEPYFISALITIATNSILIVRITIDAVVIVTVITQAIIIIIYSLIITIILIIARLVKKGIRALIIKSAVTNW